MKILDYIVLGLIIAGCVNWGLCGFFNFNLVAFIFGAGTWITRIIYGIIGLSGLYALSYIGRIRNTMD